MPAEFELIAEIFAPLAEGFPGALGLLDDAAILRPRPGRELIFTKDMLVSGVHFPEHDPARQVGKKLLRVNLSDLAAMGAEPVGYGLGIAIPDDFELAWLREFADGLAEDQATFGVSLIGGDTVSTPGPITFSLSMLGDLPEGQALTRSGAKAGDLVVVSGTIGDGALGLRVALGETLGLTTVHRDQVLNKLRQPQPQLALGQALRGIAHAAVDISDGLVADLGHICTASGLAAVIQAEKVPVSEAAVAYLDGEGGGALVPLLTGGDDYELLFAIAPESEERVMGIGDELSISLAVIGHMTEGERVEVLDVHGMPVTIERPGFSHF